MSDTSNEPFIPSMDQLLNTGENDDRKPTGTPPEGATPPTPPKTEDTPPTPPANTDTPPDAGQNAEDDTTFDSDENKSKVKNLFSSFANEAELDDDNKGIRKDLLTKYEGVQFNENGDIIDDKGEIVKSFEELYTDSISEEDITLDNKGNQIDSEGNIIKTKAELAAENSVVNQLHAESEYEFLDDNGNPKIYSDDNEGMKEFTEDVAAQRFEDFKTSFFTNNPVILDVYKHLSTGGTIESYKQPVDYNTVDLEKLSITQKTQLIKNSFSVTGMEQERIDSLVKLFEDSNQIDAQAETALSALKAYETSRKQQQDENYQKSVEEQRKANEKHWNDVKTVVDKGDLGFVQIPKNDKEAFYNYIALAIDDKGNSQEMVDRSKNSMEQNLAISYLLFKGFDLKSLISTKAKSLNVNSLKQRLIRSAKLAETSVPSDTQQSQTNNDANVTIDELL